MSNSRPDHSFVHAKGLLQKRYPRENFAGRSDQNYISLLASKKIQMVNAVGDTCMYAQNPSHVLCYLHLRLDHICIDQAPILSPLFTSTYGDEDMVLPLAYIFVGVRVLTLNQNWNVHVVHVISCKAKVGKVKALAILANPKLLGRQVLLRYTSFVCVRWFRVLENR